MLGYWTEILTLEVTASIQVRPHSPGPEEQRGTGWSLGGWTTSAASGHNPSVPKGLHLRHHPSVCNTPPLQRSVRALDQ